VPEVTVTDAENVTNCPSWEGFKLLLRESWIADGDGGGGGGGGFTVTPDEALPLKFPSPEYVAVTMPEKLERLNMAAPLLKGAFAKTLPPLTKLIVPVGVPAPGATAPTVAMSVAFEPL
jgi:hypothetical protein